MKPNYQTELASDIQVGCVICCWEKFNSLLIAAAHRAGIHLGRTVQIEPMQHKNPNRYDVVILIGEAKGVSLNKPAIQIDLEKIYSLNEFDAVETLACAIADAVYGLSLQVLSTSTITA